MLKALTIIASLFVGVSIYYWSTPDIYLFSVLEISAVGSVDAGLFSGSFLGNHAADIFWGIAINLTALLIWQWDFPPVYTKILLVYPFLHEFFQGIHILPGTFDFTDVMIYLVVLFITINKKLKLIWTKSKNT